nr:integrase, catalytic region, zinc finger, CCHC-type, peptidase aspartic, catalytic [Tanacetum cinerariifolium]
MNEKMNDPECVKKKVKTALYDYSKENYLATFTPQKQLTHEQIFWSKDLIKMKLEALKEQTTVSRPMKALMMYPLNTPIMLVLGMLSTKMSRFSNMHEALNATEKRITELESENSNLQNKIQNDDHDVMVNHFSKLEAQLTTHHKLNCVTMPAVKSKVHAQGRYAIDMEPIPLRIRNNREAHLDYLKHLKESVETLREIVKEANVERPLDKSLASSYLYTKHSQELLEYVVQIVFWYLDSSCSKHMTGDRSRLRNFVKKFIGTVRFGNDHFGAIMGYGYYVIGDSVNSRVYYMEGLGHNLFYVGQLCDSHLEVAFGEHSCYVCDTDSVELIKGSSGSNLYTILVEDMLKSSPICLLSKASKTKSWLWHHRLNHLNFGTINDIARKDLVRGLPRLKFEKDHLYSACQLGKSKKAYPLTES